MGGSRRFIFQTVFGAMLVCSLNVVLKLQAFVRQYTSRCSFDDVCIVASYLLWVVCH